MNFFRVIVTLLRFDHTNWKSIILCFIVAIIFWCFNALNKDYTTNLQFSIQFDFDTSRYVAATPLPETVLMNIKGNGWDILYKGLDIYSNPVSLSLKHPTETKKIIGTTLPILLADQLKKFQINHVITDTLYLEIDTWKTKKIKTVVDSKRFTFSTGFGKLGNIIITPDCVQIVGPKRIVESFPDSVFIDVSGHNLDEDFKEQTTINISPKEYLKYTPTTTTVFFQVTQWIQVTQAIKMDIINIPTDRRLDIIKDSITCILKVPKDKITDIKLATKQTTAYIDLQQLTENIKKIWPQVANLPTYAQIIQIDSVAIELY